MKAPIALQCAHCNKKIEVLAAEHKRQVSLGRKRFFCSKSCAAILGNNLRDDLRCIVEKICPQCREKFETMTGAKSSTFCSRECASAGSVTEKRRDVARATGFANYKNIGTAKSISDGLRTREAWKYKELESYLKSRGEPYKFEFVLPDTRHIFDLALPRLTVLIEFDGRYHRLEKQANRDSKKDIQ